MKEEERRRIIIGALRLLKRKYKADIHTFLDHSNPLELLVATMLAAQSQDAQVNKVTPALFKRYGTIDKYARAKPEDLYKYTRTLGLYKGKSNNIVNMAKMVKRDFGGRIPKTMAELTLLPGVGRKTANIVLYNAFGITEGIAIDTHCITVLNRLLLYGTTDAKKLEQEMMKIVPKSDWGDVTHLLIALGRDVCTAKVKYCKDCTLNRICPSSDVK